MYWYLLTVKRHRIRQHKDRVLHPNHRESGMCFVVWLIAGQVRGLRLPSLRLGASPTDDDVQEAVAIFLTLWTCRAPYMKALDRPT